MAAPTRAATDPVAPRDDRIIGYVRWLSLAIIPFLVGAWVILYLFPADTKRLFAWTISAPMTSMTLASAYLGGAYFFARVQRERRWHVVKTGFVSVALFAGLLGIATLLHWDKFNHQHITFWVWATLYLTTPLLVAAGWLANRRHAAQPEPGELRLANPTRWVIATVGAAALVQGIVMSVAPQTVIPLWPWALTPLTCRVVGAIFCLGCAGLSVWFDSRWSSVRLMIQVEMIMIALMAASLPRAWSSLDPLRLLAVPLLVGFAGVFAGSAWLWWTMDRRRGRNTGETMRG